MEIGSLQFVVIVVLILGAAAVALLCDLLKRKNELLRETIGQLELQVHREEEMQAGVSGTRTVSRVAPPVMSAPAPAAKQAPVEEAVPVAIVVAEPVAATNGRSHAR